MSLDFSCHFNSVIYFLTFRERLCVCVSAYQVVLLRGQRTVLLSCAFWGLNSSQVCQQAPIPSEPLHWPSSLVYHHRMVTFAFLKELEVEPVPCHWAVELVVLVSKGVEGEPEMERAGHLVKASRCEVIQCLVQCWKYPWACWCPFVWKTREQPDLQWAAHGRRKVTMSQLFVFKCFLSNLGVLECVWLLR